MRKTVITHFYNEEYLLPWWLMHHREIFDHGILIDYQSTDRSLEIIKEYCPTWEVVPSRNQQFGAVSCDAEVVDYEKKTPGWKMCLNVTEFLVGDTSLLNDVGGQQLIVPCYIMLDNNPDDNDNKLTYNESLLKQKPYGVSYNINNPITKERCCRAVHNKQSISYTTGRHFLEPNCMNMQVLWYGYSPLSEKTMKRKLQIQGKIPDSDKSQGFGHHHFTNESKLMDNYNRYLPLVQDLSVELNLDY